MFQAIRVYLILSMLLLAISIANGQTKVGVMESYLAELESNGFAGSILVAKDSKVLLTKGYGYSDVGNAIKNTPSTVFDIGSITKQFTAAAILKLEMSGIINVKDEINKYFTGLPNDKKDITIHHLLTHSSGFKGAIGDDYENITTEDFIKKAFNSKLVFAPGDDYEYSNVGYSLLAIILEQVSGMSYESYLRKHLWLASGMLKTGYSDPNFSNDEVAIGYRRNGKSWGKPNSKNWNEDEPFWNLKANGGVLSTVEDMYKWHKALLENKVLSKEAMQKYFTPYVKEGEGASSSYAYGWAIYQTSRKTVLAAHNGGNGIFFADFWRYLDDGLVIMVMNNNASKHAERLASEIGRIYFSDGYKPKLKKKSGANRIKEEKLIDFAKDAVRKIQKDDPKIWKEFILESATQVFIDFAPIETHLDYFSQFHNDIKEGKISDIDIDGDEISLSVEVKDEVINITFMLVQNEDGELKFEGMMVE